MASSATEAAFGPRAADTTGLAPMKSLESVDFYTLVESIPAPVVVTTAAGEVEATNKSIQEYFGKTAEELKDWAKGDWIHPDDLPRAVAKWRHAVETGRPYENESRHLRHDGVFRWVQVRVFPLKDSNGRVSRWLLLQTDVHDQKQAEEALSASERNLSQIINTIPALAWSARPDGSADFFNKHYLDYVGLSAEQCMDGGWTAAVYPDDLNGLIGAWRFMLDSDQAGECEARLRRFDGTYRWFLFRTNPLRDETGKTVKWYGTNIDIEDRKQAVEELRRSEAFLAQGQRLNLTGTFLWRLDTDEITFSKQLFRIFEFEPDVPVTLERISRRVHPEDVQILSGKVDLARNGIEEQDYEIRLRMPNGAIKYLRTKSFGFRGEDGRLEHIGAIQDVTERRLSEETLANLRSELAHVTRVTSLGVLAASIAHEVNQPLAAIFTNGETSLRWLDRPEPDIAKIRELTKRVVDDARRASDIVHRIRDLVTQQPPRQTLLSVNDVVKESIGFPRHEFQVSSIAVALDLAPELPGVLGDRTQLQQVIVNLATNAAQAMAQSKAARRNILVRTALSDPTTISCTIEDSGPGVAPTHLPRLFDSFFTTKESGMGMGLPISRSIVEAHGGHIRADNDSVLGGARFTFTLPSSGATTP